MHATFSSLEASQLLRDILQTKEKYQTSFIDNNNSSASIKDGYTPGCNSEMISPLLHSKSSDMAFNARDNDNDFDNENEGDMEGTTDNNSYVNGGDQSDDLDERSLDTSSHDGNLKSVEHDSFLGESKEAKRAHVENILSIMKQSPRHDTMESSTSLLTGDFKRQKRKQPQPQQHESINLHSEEMALQRQILQLQEQMQAVKRKREEDLSVSDDDDDDVIDDDVTDCEGSKPSSPVPETPKQHGVEHILGSVLPSRHVDELEHASRCSPSSENSKKQKRKQTQPQQHDNSRSIHRNGSNGVHCNGNNPGISTKNEDDTNEDGINTVTNLSRLYETNSMFRNNLFHNVNDKSLISPLHNGIDPQLYRENFYRHNFFGIRPDMDLVAAFKNVSKTSHSRSEPGYITTDEQPKLPPADLSKIAVALKMELSHAVSKAVDSVVNKVLSEKQSNTHNSHPPLRAESNSPHQLPDRHHQHEQQHNHQQQKHHNSANPFPHFLHSHQQLQQQQHRHHHQQQQSSSQVSEREALKETVNNSQGKKKSELVVPFSEHLHFLQRYGNRFHQDKMGAFEPINKPQSELITPHTGPSMSFHPHFPYYMPTQALPPMFPGEPEQTEALSLIVNTPKKKRTKVTDTRLSSPRGKPSVLQDNTPSSSMDLTDAQRHMAVAFPHFLPPVLPTSVAITNPSLSHSDFLALRLREASFADSRIPSPQDHSRDSPRSMTDSPQFMNKMDMYERASMGLSCDMMDGSGSGNGLLTSTLTPMHLRKAKLMFFFTRYPSSSILKMYFPDVMFNKNNTAQLVKWFSNFREFFYIQMEKYARQALAEGCKHSDDLVITTDSELFRHLNLHYNRNNQLEVPHNFLAAVQAALREFFKSIQSNKDTEPSWKKAIYKVIARMDESLPDFFKSPNWMEQLGDQ